MNTPTFSIQEALGFGWAIVKEKFWFIIAIMVISGLASALPDILDVVTDNEGILFIAQVTALVAGFVIDAGVIFVMLLLYDGKPAKITDIFSQYPLTFRYFVASIVYGIMIVVGFVLLIVPGVYLALRYQFYKYILIHERKDILESLQLSGALTKGHTWHLFKFALTLIGVNILGALALGVGLFVSIPVSMFATTYVYRKLSSKPVEEDPSVQDAQDFLEAIEQEKESLAKIA